MPALPSPLAPKTPVKLQKLARTFRPLRASALERPPQTRWRRTRKTMPALPSPLAPKTLERRKEVLVLSNLVGNRKWTMSPLHQVTEDLVSEQKSRPSKKQKMTDSVLGQNRPLRKHQKSRPSKKQKMTDSVS